MTFCLAFILGFLSQCESQQTGAEKNFVKQLEKEISTNDFLGDLFNDSIFFETKDQKQLLTRKDRIRLEWEKIEVLFRNRDYVINPYNIRTNEFKVEQKTWSAYYVLNDHTQTYILGLNAKRKISLVKEVIPVLPPGAPPH